jgi:hypothetical protein
MSRAQPKWTNFVTIRTFRAESQNPVEHLVVPGGTRITEGLKSSPEPTTATSPPTVVPHHRRRRALQQQTKALHGAHVHAQGPVNGGGDPPRQGQLHLLRCRDGAGCPCRRGDLEAAGAGAHVGSVHGAMEVERESVHLSVAESIAAARAAAEGGQHAGATGILNARLKERQLGTTQRARRSKRSCATLASASTIGWSTSRRGACAYSPA